MNGVGIERPAVARRALCDVEHLRVPAVGPKPRDGLVSTRRTPEGNVVAGFACAVRVGFAPGLQAVGACQGEAQAASRRGQFG